MIPILSHPLALLGLAALPALAAIYWFRQRHRRYVVSSLMLWNNVLAPTGGGDRLRRLETPLLFFLELLALLLLVAAAASPLFFMAERARPLVIVLDDSYSMQAGGTDSPRTRAHAAILEELRRRPRSWVRFLLAGDAPQFLGEPTRTLAEAAALLEGWRCQAQTARLDKALALAAEAGGEWTLLLVVTDQALGTELEKGRVQWWAFGEPQPNLAIVAANRSWRGEEERVSLTIANLSRQPTSTTLVVETVTPPVAIARRELSFSANGETTVGLDLPAGTAAIRARVADDALAIDNQVVLLPAPRRTVRIALEIGADTLRKPFEKAARAVRDVVLSGTQPDLLVTDRDEMAELPTNTWLVHLRAEKDAEAWLGPFVLDRAHPLTRGLPLTGVIWGGGKSRDLPGNPIVLAGAVPLLTEAIRDGRRQLWFRWRPDLSTLQDTPAWPALVYNLVQWRAAALPELNVVNARLGEDVVRTFATEPSAVTITDPDQRERKMVPHNTQLIFRAEQVGTYTLTTAHGREYIAVNALNRRESDLTECVSGKWGDWQDESTLRLEYRSLAGPLLLAALGVLTIHLFVAARRGSAI